MRLLFLLSVTTFSLWAQAESIRVLTYNVWGVPMISADITTRFKAICSRLKKASDEGIWDIVLLQEAWSEGDRAAFKKCGYEIVDLDNGSMDSGLLILSRYKTTATRKLTFSKNGSWGFPGDGEVFTKKGAIAAKLEAPEGPLWVVNTHLVADYRDSGDPDHSYESQRRLQTQELAAFVKDLSDQDLEIPVIVGGDLNFGPSGLAYEPLWDDLRSEEFFIGYEESKDSLDLPTYSDENPNVKLTEGKIDHLLGSPGLRALTSQLEFNHAADVKIDTCKAETMACSQEMKSMFLSDHFGLSTVFERTP